MYTKFAPSNHEVTMRNRKAHSSELLNYINKNTDKYNAIVKYTKDNYDRLAMRASGSEGSISVADQVQMNTDCPYFIAEEVTRSVSHLKHI